MKIYMLFLVSCFLLAVVMPKASLGTLMWILAGFCVLMSIGYYMFRLV